MLENVENIFARILYASCAKEVMLWLKGTTIVIIQASYKKLIEKISHRGILVIQTWNDPNKPFLFGSRVITPTSVQETPFRIRKELLQLAETNLYFN